MSQPQPTRRLPPQQPPSSEPIPTLDKPRRSRIYLVAAVVVLLAGVIGGFLVLKFSAPTREVGTHTGRQAPSTISRPADAPIARGRPKERPASRTAPNRVGSKRSASPTTAPKHATLPTVPQASPIIATRPNYESRLPPLGTVPTLGTSNVLPSSPADLSSPAPLIELERESTAVRRVLQRYEQAYDRLDAHAAAAVWPSVDARRLADIFARLREQNLDFTECESAISPNDATVTCAGALQYVRRVGNAAPQLERHSWTIYFEGKDDDWRIVRVTAR